MISKILRIPKRLKAAKYWVRALNLVASSQYAAALEALEKADDIRDETQTRLLRGYIQSVLGNKAECISEMEMAIRQLSEYSVRRRDEAKYLTAFAQSIKAKAERSLGLSVPDNPVDYTSVRLDRVPAHLRRKFQLRGHPHWHLVAESRR